MWPTLEIIQEPVSFHRWLDCAPITCIAVGASGFFCSLVDVNKDGQLNADWFAVAMHLTMRTKRGDSLPKVLTGEYIPPSSR